MRAPPITPHLWFDRDVVKAAKFYVSLLPRSEIVGKALIKGLPPGDVEVVLVDLAGQRFLLLGCARPVKFTPAVSFRIDCATKAEVDKLWKKLSAGGTARMPLGTYPFSERYGWIEDRFGISWQVMLPKGRKAAQKITPTLMFTGQQAGRAEEAMRFYASIFPRSAIEAVHRYGKENAPDTPGTVMHGAFKLAGRRFAAMDSARVHGFGFNEALSLMVRCDNQEEIDFYWKKLSADPKAGQCGWLKDKFGFSWQIVPAVMDKFLLSKDRAAVLRVMQAFGKMKKFDLDALKRAYSPL